MSQAFKNQNAMQMARSQDSWNKREREKKKQKEKQDKAEKKAERRQQGTSSIENMMAYIDENGNIVDSPPDPSKIHRPKKMWYEQALLPFLTKGRALDLSRISNRRKAFLCI
jgi:ATP-dependent 26S proteasome regulatory subunit